jgi:1-aminocyclopropane-1-carboxylate deaminase
MDDLMEDLLNNDNAHSSQNISSTATPKESPAGGWRSIDWNAQKSNIKQSVVSPSPVDVVMVRDRLVYLKRDDQLRLPGSQISGNKARKMLALNDLTKEDFPTCLVSYGGPQSNAMLALAAIVRFQNDNAGLGTDDPDRKRFVYYAKKLPKFLRSQPNGNLYRALSLGMELVEISAEEYNDLFGGDWGGQSEAPKSLEAPVPLDSVWVRTADLLCFY